MQSIAQAGPGIMPSNFGAWMRATLGIVDRRLSSQRGSGEVTLQFSWQMAQQSNGLMRPGIRLPDAGCDHCYAERFSERFRGVVGHPFHNGFDLILRPERLEQPLFTLRRKLFCCAVQADHDCS